MNADLGSICYAKVRFLKIPSLFVSPQDAQFYRATTLRTPRELPETANLKKVRFVNILPKLPFVFSNTSGDFFCAISCRNEKKVVPLQSKVQRWVQGEGSVPSRKAKNYHQISVKDLTKDPSRGFQDIVKRRLFALCSDVLKLRNFQKVFGTQQRQMSYGI